MDGIDGYDLWLSREPDADDVAEALKKYDVEQYKEIVFCGYGEPLMRLDVLLDIAKYVKQHYPMLKTRINTNGQANLFYARDITAELEGVIDMLSISLNAPDAHQYQQICHSDFGEDAFEGILEFAIHAQKCVESVRLTVVDVIGEDKVKRCQQLADEKGLALYVRQSI
jgi:TatD family-associated radical SAM protein